jgi:hypothetical protein
MKSFKIYYENEDGGEYQEYVDWQKSQDLPILSKPDWLKAKEDAEKEQNQIKNVLDELKTENFKNEHAIIEAIKKFKKNITSKIFVNLLTNKVFISENLGKYLAEHLHYSRVVNAILKNGDREITKLIPDSLWEAIDRPQLIDLSERGYFVPPKFFKKSSGELHDIKDVKNFYKKFIPDDLPKDLIPLHKFQEILIKNGINKDKINNILDKMLSFGYITVINNKKFLDNRSESIEKITAESAKYRIHVEENLKSAGSESANFQFIRSGDASTSKPGYIGIAFTEDDENEVKNTRPNLYEMMKSVGDDSAHHDINVFDFTLGWIRFDRLNENVILIEEYQSDLSKIFEEKIYKLPYSKNKRDISGLVGIRRLNALKNFNFDIDETVLESDRKFVSGILEDLPRKLISILKNKFPSVKEFYWVTRFQKKFFGNAEPPLSATSDKLAKKLGFTVTKNVPEELASYFQKLPENEKYLWMASNDNLMVERNNIKNKIKLLFEHI